MKLTERDKKAVWHPYTQMKTAPEPIAVTKADSVLFWDEDGKEYIDMVSSWWVNVHGHCHPEIGERMHAQFKTLEHIIFAGVTHESAVTLAERLLKLSAFENGKVFFSDNGSTAVEVALKMALQFFKNTGIEYKKKIIAIEGSYHGDTFGAMSVSERGGFTLPFFDFLFDVEFIPFPQKSKEAETLEKLTELVKKDDVAAFIFEPLVLGAGGMKMYNTDTLSAMLKICRENNVITIADEVMTGFGRTGKMFATDDIQFKPDLMCLSKGITGGVMPLGVTVASQKIYDAFHHEDKMKALYHGHSFTANPLSCAAALASLDIFEKQSLASYQAEIHAFYKSFMPRLEKFQIVGNPRVTGTILAFDVLLSEQSYFSDIKDKIYRHYLSDGLFVRPLGNVVYFMPPYVITKDQLEKAGESTIRLLEQLSK